MSLNDIHKNKILTIISDLLKGIKTWFKPSKFLRWFKNMMS